MLILGESAVRGRVGLLDDAWAAEETFVLLPEKPGVSEQWVRDALREVPEERRSGHFIMLTSGTTGSPKLVIGSRQRSERLAGVLHVRQESEPVAETIAILPLAYSFSFVNQWLWARVHERSLRMTNGLADMRSLGEVLSGTCSAMICLVGVQAPLLLGFFEGCRFPGIIRIHFAGGRFPQERIAALQGMFPNAGIFNNYGCAEAMPRLSVRHAGESADGADVGLPLPGVEIRSDADHVLRFRSAYQAMGVIDGGCYTPLPSDGWTATGDLGEQTGHGTWRLLGRAGEVFKRHGEKVSLQTLAATVSSAWRGQCALYRESDRLGEDGCVLALAPEADAESLRSLLLALRRRHPRAHWPLRIEAASELPLLANGKPDLRVLPELPGKVTLWRQHI